MTPSKRLSENTLAVGICKHYEQNKLIPVGVGLLAVEQLAAKMAFGLRKCVQKFKRVWFASPDASKFKGLDSLKKRLRDNKIEIQNDTDSVSSSSPSQVEQLGNALGQPASKGLDWEALAARVRAHKMGTSEATSQPPGVEKPAPGVEKPVATPARAKSSSYELPKFVVETLKAEATSEGPVFATAQTKEDAETAAAAKKAPAPKKAAAKKKQTRKNNKKGEVAGPQEEKALSLLSGDGAAPQPAEPASAECEGASQLVYKAGDFSKAMRDYIKKYKDETGASHKDAQHKWMSSDERADFLSCLSESELKKRRFL